MVTRIALVCWLIVRIVPQNIPRLRLLKIRVLSQASKALRSERMSFIKEHQTESRVSKDRKLRMRHRMKSYNLGDSRAVVIFYRCRKVCEPTAREPYGASAT